MRYFNAKSMLFCQKSLHYFELLSYRNFEINNFDMDFTVESYIHDKGEILYEDLYLQLFPFAVSFFLFACKDCFLTKK